MGKMDVPQALMIREVRPSTQHEFEGRSSRIRLATSSRSTFRNSKTGGRCWMLDGFSVHSGMFLVAIAGIVLMIADGDVAVTWGLALMCWCCCVLLSLLEIDFVDLEN